MLEIKNLSKGYKTKQGIVKAIDTLSVTIEKGDIFGFIGLSGAGKTSLARCISRLETPNWGEILLGGVDLVKLKGRRLREARKKMGFVFQHFNLLMNSNVFDNIAFPLKIARKPKDYIQARVTNLLETVGLSDKKYAYPATLSGGQKQRVGIARALASEPELVICDEATSALDPDTTKQILALIREIGQKTGVTFIVITHEMDVIRELCTHVAIMEGGEIIEQGEVLNILTDPKTQTAKRFFSKEYIDENWIKATTKQKSVICRAIFIGESARRSFINDVCKKFDIELSILSGNIESIGGTMVGSLILELIGDTDDALKYFSDNGVKVEVIIHG